MKHPQSDLGRPKLLAICSEPTATLQVIKVTRSVTTRARRSMEQRLSRRSQPSRERRQNCRGCGASVPSGSLKHFETLDRPPVNSLTTLRGLSRSGTVAAE